MFSLNQKQQQQRIDWEYITFLHLDRGPLYNRARIPSIRFSLTSLRHPYSIGPHRKVFCTCFWRAMLSDIHAHASLWKRKITKVLCPRRRGWKPTKYFCVVLESSARVETRVSSPPSPSTHLSGIIIFLLSEYPSVGRSVVAFSWKRQWELHFQRYHLATCWASNERFFLCMTFVSI